ncbi:MAG: serine/threonine protein kinase, partial [Pauljensenia sp.]
VPARAADAAKHPTSADARGSAQASSPAPRPAPIPTPPASRTPASATANTPADRRAALAERLRQRAEHRQAEDVAEERRRAQVAREEEQRARELRDARKRREAGQAQRQSTRQASPPIPRPTSQPAPVTHDHRAKGASGPKAARASTGSTPRVYGTVPQPRGQKASTRPRRSVYEQQPKKARGRRWHELDARSAQRTQPPTKTAYSRSVVAPPVPVSRQIIRAVVVAVIVIALIALLAITIRHMLGSLMHPSAGALIIEEVRTWQSPWPTV